MGEISGKEALQLLLEGNKRFTEGNLAVKDTSAARRENLSTNGQKPFAIVVTCSDSRVPPELIFDQALGDIFVIRTAGNVVDEIATGSVEYAVEHLEVPLLVVMGHEKCGAVTAAVEGGEAPGSISAIVKKITPSVQKAKGSGFTGSALCEAACMENIGATVADLIKSPIVKHFVKDDKLKVVAAKYLLESGEVRFCL
ncbi:MAG: carbonic anhydrase [Peptococcaceae bacterium]|nr:carbonic anhydrase [Peptococcaceae bacterium]